MYNINHSTPVTNRFIFIDNFYFKYRSRLLRSDVDLRVNFGEVEEKHPQNLLSVLWVGVGEKHLVMGNEYSAWSQRTDMLFTSSVTMKSDLTFLGFIFCTCKTGLINIYFIGL